MNQARCGKIARLPHNIREQLNRRLQDGEEGQQLVDWLNSLPEVNKIMAELFGGRAIREQNLSDWRAGGYREWLLRDEALHQSLALSNNAFEINRNVGNVLADNLAAVLAARYAAWLAKWDGAAGGEAENELRLLNLFCQGIVGLQRSAHQATRSEFELERLQQELAKSASAVAARADAVQKILSPVPPPDLDPPGNS